MKNIVLLGHNKPMISALISSIITLPSFELIIYSSIHVVSDGVHYRCVYPSAYPSASHSGKNVPIDTHVIDYLHIASSVLVCYDLEEGDRACAYWIDEVQQHVPTTPIVMVGFRTSDDPVPPSEVAETYHVTRLVSNPMEDRVVKEYLETKPQTREETFCCCLVKYI